MLVITARAPNTCSYSIFASLMTILHRSIRIYVWAASFNEELSCREKLRTTLIQLLLREIKNDNAKHAAAHMHICSRNFQFHKIKLIASYCEKVNFSTPYKKPLYGIIICTYIFMYVTS